MPEYLIEGNGLSKHYRLGGRTVTALDDVSLVVAPGDYVAITGASGSGKTTLMKILGCLERPSIGQYRLNGIDVAGLTSDRMAEVRNHTIGFLFQSFLLLPQASAVENVEMPLAYAGVSRSERQTRARAALASVGLADREDHRPGRLSGGEQQRVALARAVVNCPELLLADEPTGALDGASADAVMRLFAELNHSGVTIVLVTHDMSIAAHARRVFRFKLGRLETEEMIAR
ncbi:ABC transporter ATP-binding protein [Bradyrhizobium brasilense]|uniref:ABC transporter ATP-binding protein n=1 Tax=Bradyrhizobium brasilense TaxID=1419277 RepID=UPI001F3C90D6|nr:ABC transporter ATP-binding protein [Bradyrhizobium brasilense]